MYGEESAGRSGGRCMVRRALYVEEGANRSAELVKVAGVAPTEL